MKRIKTLIKELMEIEHELDNRDNEEVKKVIESMHIKGSVLVNVVYTGLFDYEEEN